jgi:hypothetical protein
MIEVADLFIALNQDRHNERLASGFGIAPGAGDRASCARVLQ